MTMTSIKPRSREAINLIPILTGWLEDGRSNFDRELQRLHFEFVFSLYIVFDPALFDRILAANGTS